MWIVLFRPNYWLHTLFVSFAEFIAVLPSNFTLQRFPIAANYDRQLDGGKAQYLLAKQYSILHFMVEERVSNYTITLNDELACS